MSNRPWLDVRRVDLIAMRVEATSRGPWVASIEGENHTSGSSCIITADGSMDLSGASDHDIAFIASARQDVPYLLAELRRLAAILESR
jgi:hypothetical protein